MLFLKNFVSFLHRRCAAKPKRSMPENGLPRRFAPRNDLKAFVTVFCLCLFFALPARAVCTLPDGDHGDMLYNLDHTVMQYCNGTKWISMDASRAGGGGIPADPTDCTDRAPISLVWDASGSRIIGTCVDRTPDNFNFNDIIDQTINTLVSSNIVQIKGVTGASPIQIGGDGNPAYRICSTSNCSTVIQDWSTTAGTISNNQFVQIRLTSASQISTPRSATLRIGQASDQWDVTTSTLRYGPTHTFAGATSRYYISTGQGGCSVGTAAADADYFCKHFYFSHCTAISYVQGTLAAGWQMHKNSGCTSDGTSIPDKTCDGGSCKIWNTTNTNHNGLYDIVCQC